MQLKNNNPVSMEKRTDLASLFCMIGRHGPAVAVAVIAMVSVVAGFFIYRTVRGKRRKAAAGAGDSRSPGARTDASLLVSEAEAKPEPSLEDTRSSAESTALNEENQSENKEARVTRSPYDLRNRRSAAEKNASSDCRLRTELEKEYNTTRVLESSSVAEMCIVKDVSQQNLAADMEAAEENHESSSKPVMTSGGHENKEVSRSQVDVTTKNIFNETSSQEEVCCVFNSSENIPESRNRDPQQGNQTTPETISVELSLEEAIISVEAVPLSSKASEIEEVHHPVNAESSVSHSNNPLLPEEEMETVHDKYGDDQQMAEQENVSSAFEQTKVQSSEQDHCQDVMSEVLGVTNSFKDANHSPISEGTEGMDHSSMENPGSVLVNPDTLEYSKQEVKSEQEKTPSCNKNEDELLFSEEHFNSSLVLKTDLPCLNLTVDPETVHEKVPSATKADSFDLPLDCLQPENEDAIAPELAEVTGLDVENSQSKTKTGSDVLIPESPGYFVSSYEDPITAVCETASLTVPVMSTQMVYSDLSSFQNQESDQIRVTEDLSEVAAVPVPDMAESIKSEMGQIQLLSCDQSELTWSSSGLGEESGISSMTVSPDLPDIDTESDNMVLSVTDHYPDSEDHPEAKSQFLADDGAPPVANENSAETRLHPCPSQISQQAQAKDELSKATEETPRHEIKEGSDQEIGPITVSVAASDASLTELRKEVDIKAVEDKTTEISIMEATMDNNEWITDGNHQVLPWMSSSASSLPHNTQTDLVSSKHDHSSVPVDAPCRDPGIPSSTEVKQTDMVTDEKKGIKKVVAVQPMPQNVNVTFRIHYLTHSPYQKVAVTGNQQELGNWREYILLDEAKDGLWSAVVSLPAESHVEWKFVVVDQGKVCRWEECGNRLLDTGYAEDLLVHKWWGLM